MFVCLSTSYFLCLSVCPCLSLPHNHRTQNSLSYTSEERDGDDDQVGGDDDQFGGDDDEEEYVEDEEESSMSSSSAFTPTSNSWQSTCGPAALRTCQAKKLPPLTDLALSSFLESRKAILTCFAR